MTENEDYKLLNKYSNWHNTSPLEKVITMEKRVIFIRWLGIVLGIGTVPFLGSNNVFYVYLVILYALTHNLVFQFYIIRFRPEWLLKPVVLTLGDNMMTSAVVFIAGGINTDFYLIYFLLAVLSAIRFGRKEATVALSMSIVLYIFVSYSHGDMNQLSNWVTLIFRMGFVAITGLFVGYVEDKSRDLQQVMDKAHEQLNKSTTLVTKNLELHTVLQTATDQARILLDANLSLLFTEKESGRLLEPVSRKQFEKTYCSYIQSIPLTDHDVKHLSILLNHLSRVSPLFTKGKDMDDSSVRVAECMTDEDLSRIFSVEIGTTCYVISAALKNGEQLLGYLYLIKFLDKYSKFSKTQRNMLGAFASRISVAITNSLVYNQSKMLALTDPVTGLYNHRFLQETLKDEIHKSSVSQKPTSIVVLDIDSFKNFNDSYGHSIGDIALKSVATMIQETVLDNGFAARYGGDEFVVVLPGIGNQEACTIAESIRKKAVEFSHVPTHEALSSLSISLGVATYPSDGKNAEELFVAADLALYVAKHEGKNVVKSAENLSSAIPFHELPTSLLTDPHEIKQLELLYKKVDGLHTSFYKNNTDAEMLQTIEAFVAAVDAKDHYTYDHSEKVALYSSMLAEEIGLPMELVEKIRIGALLHDVGKIGVPDHIVKKPGELTAEEYEMIKKHPEIGFKIIQPIKQLKDYLPIILYHHEWYNGNGYPHGLKAEAIPLEARIVGICDAYDAMTSDRPYRRAMQKEQALATIHSLLGVQFDPQIWNAFLEMLKKLGSGMDFHIANEGGSTSYESPDRKNGVARFANHEAV